MGQHRAQKHILDIARPMETAIIQGSGGRGGFYPFLFGDPYRPLQFVHFSDIHSILDHWDRIMTFINHYEKYLSFAIHTGDFVSGTIEGFVDLYTWGVPTNIPVLNCVGNHDRAPRAPKQRVHDCIFNKTDNWGATFMDCEASMTYYKDFPESGIRLIVLDDYFDLDAQVKWLRDLLARSREEGMHVMTARHQLTSDLVDIPDITFHSAMDFTQVAPQYQADAHAPRHTVFEDPIGDFIEEGGHFICNLCGHYHRDHFGYTARGVLNIAVEMATCWAPWDDTRRVFDSQSYDCFNVTSVDVNTGIIRIVRIGNNFDYYMRRKERLCFDYVNRKVIFNG